MSNDDNFDGLTYHKERLSRMIWGGFFNANDLKVESEDLAYDPDAEPHLDALLAHAKAEMKAKRTAEASWPATTDWDRLDTAFTKLIKAGILALHKAGMTQSDSHGDAAEVLGAFPGRFRGYVFYHGQDVDRVLDGEPLFIGFEAVSDDPEAKTALGIEAVGMLRSAGLTVEWAGDAEERPSIVGLDWKKRTDWDAPTAEVFPNLRAMPPSGKAPRPTFLQRLFGRA